MEEISLARASRRAFEIMRTDSATSDSAVVSPVRRHKTLAPCVQLRAGAFGGIQAYLGERDHLRRKAAEIETIDLTASRHEPSR